MVQGKGLKCRSNHIHHHPKSEKPDVILSLSRGQSRKCNSRGVSGIKDLQDCRERKLVHIFIATFFLSVFICPQQKLSSSHNSIRSVIGISLSSNVLSKSNKLLSSNGRFVASNWFLRVFLDSISSEIACFFVLNKRNIPLQHILPQIDFKIPKEILLNCTYNL